MSDTATGVSGALGALGDATFGMAHRFVVVIDNPTYDLGFWQKASGLGVRWEVCTYRAGDQGNDFWIAPGTTRYENIKLTRPVSPASNVVQQWLAATSARMRPLTGAVQLLSGFGVPIVQWRLYQFFPVAWSVDEFSAPNAAVVTETLEFAHTGFLDDLVFGPLG